MTRGRSGAALSLVTLCALWAALPLRAQAPDLLDAGAVRRFDAAERFVLGNGLEVLLAPEAGRRQIALTLTVRAGAADDPPGLEGLAHVTEHMMYGGSRHAASADVQALLERVGATDHNAVTYSDRTLYWTIAPGHALETLLWLESDRLAYLLASADEAGLEAQRAVVLREEEERVIEAPASELGRALAAELFCADHPFVRQQTRASVEAITLADVQYFFQAYYAPDRVRLSLVGGFDPVSARAAIERYFGSIVASRAQRADRTLGAPILSGEVHVEHESPEGQSALMIEWISPAWQTEGDAELEVAAYALAGPTGTLRALVDEGLALRVRAHQASTPFASVFWVRVDHTPQTSWQAIAARVDAAIEALRREGPSLDSLRGAQRVHEHGLIGSLDELGARAEMLATPLPSGRIFRVRDDVLRFRAIDSASVARVAAATLGGDRLIVRLTASTTEQAR